MLCAKRRNTSLYHYAGGVGHLDMLNLLVIPSLGWPKTGDRLIRYNPSLLPRSHSCSYCWNFTFFLHGLVVFG